MPSFGKSSNGKLITCHHDLQVVFNEVVTFYDCTVLEGSRDRVRQEALFQSGSSKVQYPDGKHNKSPSLAADVAPYPLSFEESQKNLARYYYLAGCVRAVSTMLLRQGVISHRIRWGGDWNMNDVFDDQTFDDLVHYELVAQSDERSEER